MRGVITSRGFAEKGEFQGSSSPNDPESILREAGFEVVNLSSAGFGAQSTENEIFEALNLSSLLNVSSTGTPFFSNPLIF